MVTTAEVLREQAAHALRVSVQDTGEGRHEDAEFERDAALWMSNRAAQLEQED